MPKTQKKFVEPWKEFAKRWRKWYTPPGLPSKEAIEIYRKFTKQAIRETKRQPHGLILGATPELRDLLTELKFKVTMIDINIEMILAMSELTKRKNPDEIIVKGDWTSSPLASNYFDVVLGDLVMPNVPMEKQGVFLKETKRVLKPGGYWITKTEIQPDDFKQDDPDSIIEKYIGIPWHKNRAMELFVDLHYAIWDPKTKITDTNKVKQVMNKYKTKGGKYKHPDKKITKYLNAIWEMWKPMKKQWAHRYESNTEKQLAPYFKIIKKHVLSDCY